MRDAMATRAERETKQLKDTVLSMGAVAVGIAELSEFLIEPPTGGLFAITFGLAYPKPEIEHLPDDSDLQEAIHRLAARAQEIYSLIECSVCTQNEQVRCCRYDAVERVFGALTPPLGQKPIAVLAGLGWIGKSSLLCTPASGPRVRLGTLFTDAHLEPDTPFAANHCGECRICQDVCPVGAVTGEKAPYMGLTGFRIDSEKCRARLCKNESLLGRREFCGLCLKECPFGKKAG
jgi:epoxyqueuosine reductase